MNRGLIFILFFLAFIPLCATAQNIQTKQVYSSDFVIDEIPRTISFYIPANYGNGDFYPLVVMLHPAGETAIKFVKEYSDIIQAYADSMNSVVLYPDAVKRRWNSTTRDKTDSINDVGFINIMITYFVQQYSCNPNNIFITGFGNGGNMAEKLACKLTLPISAVAAFKTDTISQCIPASNISILNTTSVKLLNTKLPYKNAIADAFNFFESKLKR